MTLLEQLQKMTITVADTGDFESIAQYKPRDATTNPSLVTAAAKLDRYAGVVERTLRWAEQRAGDRSVEAVARRAADRLAIEFGLEMLKIIPGRVSTELDAHHADDTEICIRLARDVIAQYEAAGASRDRILIKLASTWEGIRAAEVLEREGIHCNLTLLFGIHQAIAAAEAGVTLISPFVGRILDWHKKDSGRDSYPPPEDPGVVSVTRIYNYYKHHGHRTEVMGASFRNVGEIIELAGCDLLTIAPNLFAELASTEGTLVRRLSPENARGMAIEKITVDERTFRSMHATDRMASDKLAEGIQGFCKASEALEDLLVERVRAAR